MAASRRAAKRSSEGVGWLATLAGAALLIVAGFGVGLVAGTVFEEPELVMEHLAGNLSPPARRSSRIWLKDRPSTSSMA